MLHLLSPAVARATWHLTHLATKSGEKCGLGRRPSNERGQVAILFALVFTFMFILFAMVVDFGHLVNTKINLQLAADSAAYAGAAWQARTLNKLSMVNYKLRQDLKELAMRVQVTHLRHNRNFPRGDGYINGARQSHNTEPFICQQAHGYRALSGLTYANDTNLCRNASPATGGLPPIVVPPIIAAFDPFAVAIAQQIRKIADAANQECRAAAEDNRVLTDHLIDVYTKRSQFHEQQAQAIEHWLNHIGGGTIERNDDHPVNAVAYESAWRNLAAANKYGEFKMEVLPPSGNEYIRLQFHRMRASIFFVNFNVVGDGCVGRPSFKDFNDMVIGFTKDQPIITYYAVKLTTKPEMLFMPQNWVDNAFPTLEAVSAAKPFGSRIGPDSTTDQLVPVPNRPGNNNRMINFSFIPNDPLGIMNAKVMAYLDKLHPLNSAGRSDGNQTTGWPDANKADNLRMALQAIRTPTIFDAAFYSIFPDPNQSNDYFEPQYAMSVYPDYLEASDPANQIIQTPESPTKAYFPDGVGPAWQRGGGWIGIAARNISGGNSYGNYATEAPSSHSVVSGVSLPDMGEGKLKEFGWASREQIHSGWTPEGGQPRIGYSVKFIGFDALTRTMRVKVNDSNQKGPIANPPTGDDNVVANRIYH